MRPATGVPVLQDDHRSLAAARTLTGAALRTPEELAEIVSQFAQSGEWIDKVRLRVEQRWYERLQLGADYDLWVISWMPGQSTGYHDHGASSGAFVVATGVLEEHRPGERTRVINPGKARAFGPDYAHDVRNVSLAPAVSIHAYSPPLSDMNEYELDGTALVPRERTAADAADGGERLQGQKRRSSDWNGALTIEQVLSAARARLRRLSPEEAYEEMLRTGATLVDIRSESQRASEGSIPGALIVERNVLEWRFDPASSARLPVAIDHEIQVIVFCSEGYTSSLAAAVLQDIGLTRATDIVGGFLAWRAMGLPTISPSTSS
jgi:rhodanese-related sulfurtransferase